MVSALDSGSNDPGSSSAGAPHCVLRQDSFHSQCLSSPKCINGYRQFTAGGNPAMD